MALIFKYIFGGFYTHVKSISKKETNLQLMYLWQRYDFPQESK